MRKTTSIVIFLLLLGSFSVFAARTVRGTITHPCLNKGLSGALVKAFDSDTGSSDDYMGQATTNSSGRYSISYTGKHWDKAPHRVTRWRPDIYIKIYMKLKGKWVNVKNSRVHSNHKMKNDLTINLKAKYPNNPGHGGSIGSVYGFIKNAQNGQPVPQAKICMKVRVGQEICVDSKQDGAYILNTFTGHCFTLRITAEGYQTKEIPGISIIPGGFTNVPANLYPIRRHSTARRTLRKKQ